MEELFLVIIAVIVMCIIAYKDSSSLCVLLPVGCLFAYTMKIYGQKKNSAISVPIEKIKEQEDTEDQSSVSDDDSVKFIENQNKLAIEALYSDQNMNTIDHGISKFNQRLGDRDRKAIIAQIKGRRNPTMEPYFRQELEDQGTVRWWDNEDVMVRMLNKNQLATIPM